MASDTPPPFFSFFKNLVCKGQAISFGTLPSQFFSCYKVMEAFVSPKIALPIPLTPTKKRLLLKQIIQLS
jgi:hypothetical protein